MAQTNYVKEIYKLGWNYAVIGIALFFMFYFEDFLTPLVFLLVIEIMLAFIAQTTLAQRYINASRAKEDTDNLREAEKSIIKELPEKLKKDFEQVSILCDKIEKHASVIDSAALGDTEVSDILQKLSKFRFSYARILRAKTLLDNRDMDAYRELDDLIVETERAILSERERTVKSTLEQNLKILKRRKVSAVKLNDLGRLFNARLSVVKNSLGLMQDEVYRRTDVSGLSGLVDDLNATLEINDDLQMNYEELLDEAGLKFTEEIPIDVNKKQKTKLRI